MEINTSFATNIPVTQDKVPLSAQAVAPESAAVSGAAVPAQAAPVLPETNIAELLKLFGFKPSAENVELLQTLLDKGFPVSKDNLQSLNRSVKLSGLPPDRAVFLMQNDMKLSTQNAGQLKGYINREIRLLGQLSGLMEQIDAMPDEAQKNTLLRLLAGMGNETPRPAVNTPLNLPSVGLAPENQPAAALIKNTAAEIPPPNQELPLTLVSNEAENLSAPAKEAAREVVIALASEPEQPPEKLAVEFERVTKDLPPEQKKAALDAAVKELVQAGKPELAEALEKAVGKESISLRQDDGPRPRAELLRENNELRAIIENKLMLDPKKAETRERIDELLTEIKRGAEAVKSELSKSAGREDTVFKAAESITKNIDFLNEIRNCVYVQLPVDIGGQKTEAELYVFSDKKNKNKKASSALIALDLAALKRFECYLTKNDNAVACQFRLELPEAETLIRANIERLNGLLSGKNLRLEAVSYMRLSEPFVLTDDEPNSKKKHGYDTTVDIRA